MPDHVFHHPTLCLLPLKSTPPGEQGKPVFLSCIVFLRGEEDFTVQYLTREHHNRKWTEGKRTFINCFRARIFFIFFALDRSNLPASLRVVFCIASHSCPTFSWWLSAFHIGILTSWWLLSSEGQTHSVWTKVTWHGQSSGLRCVSETGILPCCPDWPGLGLLGSQERAHSATLLRGATRDCSIKVLKPIATLGIFVWLTVCSSALHRGFNGENTALWCCLAFSFLWPSGERRKGL